jgi:transposase
VPLIHTTVPVLAKGETITGRLWAYVRDDLPFGQGPPAVLFHYSRDRRGEHSEQHLAGYAGILQADAYGGFGDPRGRFDSPPAERIGCLLEGSVLLPGG